MTNNRWTPDEIINLRKFVAEARSAAFAASQLGTHSRNSCIGKALQLGIKFSSISVAGTGAAVNRQSEDGVPISNKDMLPQEMSGTFVGKGIPFISVRDGECRFPYDGHAKPRCCGKPTATNKVYCEAHLKVCKPHARIASDGRVTYGHRCARCLREFYDEQGLKQHHLHKTKCGEAGHG